MQPAHKLFGVVRFLLLQKGLEMAGDIAVELLLARGDAELVACKTGSDDFRQVIHDHYENPSDDQLRDAASLQRSTYAELRRFMPNASHEEIAKRLEGADLYMETTDKNLARLQKQHAENRVLAGKIATKIAEYNFLLEESKLSLSRWESKFSELIEGGASLDDPRLLEATQEIAFNEERIRVQESAVKEFSQRFEDVRVVIGKIEQSIKGMDIALSLKSLATSVADTLNDLDCGGFETDSADASNVRRAASEAEGIIEVLRDKSGASGNAELNQLSIEVKAREIKTRLGI